MSRTQNIYVAVVDDDESICTSVSRSRGLLVRVILPTKKFNVLVLVHLEFGARNRTQSVKTVSIAQEFLKT